MSQLLHTQLDKQTLALCVTMLENGVNPEALAVRLSPCRAFAVVADIPQAVIQELRREGSVVTNK